MMEVAQKLNSDAMKHVTSQILVPVISVLGHTQSGTGGDLTFLHGNEYLMHDLGLNYSPQINTYLNIIQFSEP